MLRILLWTFFYSYTALSQYAYRYGPESEFIASDFMQTAFFANYARNHLYPKENTKERHKIWIEILQKKTHSNYSNAWLYKALSTKDKFPERLRKEFQELEQLTTLPTYANQAHDDFDSAYLSDEIFRNASSSELQAIAELIDEDRAITHYFIQQSILNGRFPLNELDKHMRETTTNDAIKKSPIEFTYDYPSHARLIELRYRDDYVENNFSQLIRHSEELNDVLWKNYESESENHHFLLKSFHLHISHPEKEIPDNILNEINEFMLLFKAAQYHYGTELTERFSYYHDLTERGYLRRIEESKTHIELRAFPHGLPGYDKYKAINDLKDSILEGKLVPNLQDHIPHLKENFKKVLLEPYNAYNLQKKFESLLVALHLSDFEITADLEAKLERQFLQILADAENNEDVRMYLEPDSILGYLEKALERAPPRKKSTVLLRFLNEYEKKFVKSSSESGVKERIKKLKNRISSPQEQELEMLRHACSAK